MLGLVAVVSAALAASAGPWPELDSPVAPQGDGRHDAALIVAVSDYPELDPIPGATENADLWYEWLIATRGVAPEHVHRLYDREAVKETIEEDLLDATREVGPGGTLWVLFITHGAPATDGKDVVLVGADATRTARSLYARSISRSEVLAATASAPGAVVVLDSCFSGQGYSGARLVDDALAPVIPVDALRPAASTSVVAVAAGPNEFAGPLPGAGRPAFSYLLLGALQGWGDRDGDRRVTPSEAVAWTKGALSMTVQGRKQSPGIEVVGAEVVLPAVRPAVTSADLLEIAETLRGSATLTVDSSLQIGATDLVRKQQELLELQRQREEVERREAEQRAAIEAAEAAQVQKATAGLQAAAQSEWTSAASLTAGSTPEAREYAKLFLDKYGAAAVVVNGRSHPVTLPEVKEAQAVLARVDAGSGGRAPTTEGARPVVAERVTQAPPVGSRKDWTSPTVGLMRWIPPGSFTMGSPASEPGRDTDEEEHQVTLSRGFLLMAHEVTQEQWEAEMGKNPSRFSTCGEECPVERVTWLEAVTFANAVSKREGLKPAYVIAGETVAVDSAADGYRLPVEAEWEYAARGATVPVHDDDLCTVANVANAGRRAEYVELGYKATSAGFAACDDGHTGPGPVGGYEPSGWGLYDTRGNVAEWVWDRYAPLDSESAVDPEGPGAGAWRVCRGGAWNSGPEGVRLAERTRMAPLSGADNVGLRLARTPR